MGGGRRAEQNAGESASDVPWHKAGVSGRGEGGGRLAATDERPGLGRAYPGGDHAWRTAVAIVEVVLHDMLNTRQKCATVVGQSGRGSSGGLCPPKPLGVATAK